MVLFLNSSRLSHSSSSRKIFSFRIVENFLLRNVVWVRCVLLLLPARPEELIVWLVWPRYVRALVADWSRLLALDFVFLREFDAVLLREPLLKLCEEVVVAIEMTVMCCCVGRLWLYRLAFMSDSLLIDTLE